MDKPRACGACVVGSIPAKGAFLIVGATHVSASILGGVPELAYWRGFENRRGRKARRGSNPLSSA